MIWLYDSYCNIMDYLIGCVHKCGDWFDEIVVSWSESADRAYIYIIQEIKISNV